METKIELFAYEQKEVRTIVKENGENWFAGIDVCNILGYANSRDTIKKLDEDEKELTYLNATAGQKRQTWIISESGLYSLILNSEKSEAKAFKRWVTHEVLPSLRKRAGVAALSGASELVAEIQGLMNLIAAKESELASCKSVVQGVKTELRDLKGKLDEKMRVDVQQLRLF